MPVTRAALDAASRAALRAILAVRPEANAMASPSRVPEQAAPSDPPLLSAAEFLERAPLRPIPVSEPEIGFSAFLDGTQSARILAWHEGVPYVFGVAGAVVRDRRERRLHTWAEPLLEHRTYLPFAYVSGFQKDTPGLTVVDTTAVGLGPVPSRHPAALLERALFCLQRDRERLEQRLAEAWASGSDGVLCADGPLPPFGPVRLAENVVGAIKTHRTLYAEGEALDLVLALRRGERSLVFRVAAAGREPVASWYLRVRDPAAQGAFWGLVRIEASITADVTARADTISRWLLAENAPLALPDSRWDRMTYGVRDCESFLRAVS